MVVLGVQERFLVAEGILGSFLLRAQAPCVVGHAAGPRVLVRGRHLDAEAVEVLHGLRERRCGRAPSGADELSNAVQPVVVEVADRAVTQELACHEQRGQRVRGRATTVG